MSGDRLFGLPGAEYMEFDVATVYETNIEPFLDRHDRRLWVIEEWTVRPPSSHLPPLDRLLDWACEWVAEGGEVDESGDVNFSDAAQRGDVKAAFQAALDLWARKVGYRMADKRVGEHHLTWAHDGQPLIDGEPLYRKADL